MTFFVDANILIYAEGESAYRESCQEVLAAVGAGAAGRTSTAALEEVWHFELAQRQAHLAGLAADGYVLFAPLLSVTDAIFRRALDIDAPKLGANDRLHVATCLVNEIDVVVSADSGFDGVRGIRRVDPLDERARRRLLRTSS